MHWYSHVRHQFISADFPEALLEGLKNRLRSAVSERIKRLKEFVEKNGGTDTATGRWPEFENCFTSGTGIEEIIPLRDSFLEIIASGIRKSGENYLTVIKNLEDEESNTGTQWLQGIVDAKTSEATRILVPGL